MIKKIKLLNGHKKPLLYSVQAAINILFLLVTLQAISCPGKSLIPLGNLADVIVAKMDKGSFTEYINNLIDISQPHKNKINGKSRSWLYAVVNSGKEELVKVILARMDQDQKTKWKNPEFANSPDESSGKTPLGIAAEKGYNHIVAELLNRIYINATQVDNKGRTPLHMAAVFKSKNEFKLIWNKVNSIEQLFKRDREGNSVFASAYLPEPRFFDRSNASLKMFKAILETIKELTDEDFKKITAEIMDLQHSKKISQKYSGKLQNEMNLIKHPKPSPSPSSGKQGKEKSE
ncbi:ankyrin repeat domain-containing protein [Cardinium endosymbiont of Nabis limbatus]|uniref:ankyrin repeat domain-containing protein n=1 Tax=Cardinium endosymbiont of Nabis limbatus TaxID=3066217 RepID=UPI003AF40492